MSNQVDVLFAVPGNLRQVYQHLAQQHAIEQPTMALIIATYLKRKGLGVSIIDQTPLGLTVGEVAGMVNDANPRLVIVPVYGYQPSASTQNMPAAREMCAAIKSLRPDLKILMTGTHPAALPERTLVEEPVDFVCDGEGPVTAYELVCALKAGDSLEKVHGLWYRPGGSLQLFQHTSPAPNVDLDRDIGVPAWDLLPSPKLYRAHDWHANFDPDMATWSPYASLRTTEGCPYHCAFCCIQTPFKTGEAALGIKESVNSYRRRSPENVVEEIELLVTQHGVRHFKIHDEMFVLNPAHVLGITRLVRERFGDSLNFWAYTRVDTTQERFLAELRSAGFRWLCVGIEAANSEVRDGQDKSFTDSDVAKVVERITNAGIHVLGNYIFGLPHDTLETMEETLQLAIALNHPHANFYSAMAYPGSKLHADAVRLGLPLPETHGDGWIGYSQHAFETFPLPTAALSSAEVLRFRDEAVRRYCDRSEYKAMLRQRMGPGAPIRIDETLSLPPLRRKIIEAEEKAVSA